jgi:hypothetical protein
MVEAFDERDGRVGQQGPQQAGDEARIERVDVGIDERDDVTCGHGQPGPHRVALAVHRRQAPGDVVLGHDERAGGPGRGRGAICGPRVDHDDLIHQGNRLDQSAPDRRRDRPDGGLLVAGGHDDAHRGLALGLQQLVWRPILRTARPAG